ncbi:hypothetical protein, partial [Acidithiobacillus thiooxidans]|uniref:hypothetical protein n=1 Tax=Acidithiobacillus thiooxidans TaxID=930 RepID=UPI001C31661A
LGIFSMKTSFSLKRPAHQTGNSRITTAYHTFKTVISLFSSVFHSNPPETSQPTIQKVWR